MGLRETASALLEPGLLQEAIADNSRCGLNATCGSHAFVSCSQRSVVIDKFVLTLLLLHLIAFPSFNKVRTSRRYHHRRTYHVSPILISTVSKYC